MTEPTKHKLFVSFHHADEAYRKGFDQLFANDFISKSVENGDIDPDNSDEYVKRLIQQENIADCSVLAVLYGADTCNRKHVDWEIYAALTEKVSGRSGLMVILLPTFPVSPFDEYGRYDERRIYPHLHPRTAKNLASGYAHLYFWPGLYPHLPSVPIRYAIQTAFDRRLSHGHLIDNSELQYRYNR